MTKFLTINCSSVFNGVLGRPLLQATKVVTSIHYLAMKFPTTVGIGQVQGRQWDSRKCYNKSLELAEKREELPQTMEAEKTSIGGSMETNINPRLQEEESTIGPIEEIIEVQVDPSKPSRVVKISKGLQEELAQQLMKFL